MTNVPHPDQKSISESTFNRLKNRLSQFLAQHSPSWDQELRRFLLQRIISEDMGKRYRERICVTSRRAEIDATICEIAQELLEQLDGNRARGGRA